MGGDTAAAIVSGTVAALLSVRPELIGQPSLVKHLLGITADDLARDRTAQGRGLVQLRSALVVSTRTDWATGSIPVPLAVPVAGRHVEAGAVPLVSSPVAPPLREDDSSRSSRRFAVALSYAGEQREYVNDAELIVVFISADYDKKEWCGLEWRTIRDIIKKRRDREVMPLRFDDTEVPGLFSIDGYVDLRERDPERVGDLIIKRLTLNEQAARAGRNQ